MNMGYNTGLVNVNLETGIRYGVTSNIPDWILDDAMDWECPAEQEAYAEYCRDELRRLATSGDLTADDFDGFEHYPDATDEEKENTGYIEDYIGGLSDQAAIDVLDAFDCNLTQAFWYGADFSESARHGEIDGIKLMLSGLGGATLLWVFESPYFDTVRLCSPCVPNAGDIDSPDCNGYRCYTVNPLWYTAD